MTIQRMTIQRMTIQPMTIHQTTIHLMTFPHRYRSSQMPQSGHCRSRTPRAW
jgi:hypothetical protein